MEALLQSLAMKYGMEKAIQLLNKIESIIDTYIKIEINNIKEVSK